MYAVVSTGGKQYRVEAGSELIVERLAADPGASVTFDRVLLVGDGETISVGTPTVDGASVSGTVIGEARGPKLIVFKFKQKVKYRRTNGHRQHLTRVRIDEISANGRRETAPKDEAAPTRPKASAAKTEAVEATAEAEAPPKPARRRTAKPKAAAADEKADATAEADAEGAAVPEEAEAKPARRRRATTKKAETAEE
jgi:large subunit ribosomal protein L21